MKASRFLAVAASLAACSFVWVEMGGTVEGDEGLQPPRGPVNLKEAMNAATPGAAIPVLISFKAAPTQEDYAELEKKHQFKSKHKYKIIPCAAAELTQRQIKALRKNRKVERIELDRPGQYQLDSAKTSG